MWIGERTRELDGAHVEFCRGIKNPVGVKISDKCVPDDLLALLDAVNTGSLHVLLSCITCILYNGYMYIHTIFINFVLFPKEIEKN